MPVPCLSFKARLRNDPVSGKLALLYPESVLLLSPSAGAIVELCDGKRSVDEVVADLAARYHVPMEMMQKDVTECLEKLSAKGLIDLKES